MLEIYLTDGEDQGVWLKLPSSSAELGEAYAKLEEAKEYPKIEIHDVKSPRRWSGGLFDRETSHIPQSGGTRFPRQTDGGHDGTGAGNLRSRCAD